MKKLTIFIAVLSFLGATFWAAKPAAAWNAITGTVYAGNGVRWTLGGTVEVFDHNFASCGTTALVTGNPATNGNYNVALPGGCAPANGQPLYIVLQTNSGPGGTPSTQFAQITQFPINAPFVQNFNTGTTPTAVTLASFSTPSGALASATFPYLFAAVATLLGTASYVALRRRRAPLTA